MSRLASTLVGHAQSGFSGANWSIAAPKSQVDFVGILPSPASMLSRMDCLSIARLTASRTLRAFSDDASSVQSPIHGLSGS